MPTDPSLRCSMDHSILIPTYNRPANLRRLLSYFERSGLDLPVLVLDSSTDEQKTENRAVVRKSSLDVAIHEFDSSLHPFEKRITRIPFPPAHWRA